MEEQRFRDVTSGGLDDDGGRPWIAAIGIDRYTSWGPLHNAVNDARGALRLFGELGFRQIRAPLIDEAATGEAIRRLATDDLTELGPNDSLVLVFAGHGHTITRTYPDGTQARRGYIIPVDGDRPSGRAGSWLRLDAWLSDIAHLPARHILVVLDACHGGIALTQVDQWRGDRPADNAIDRPLGQLRKRRSRRIITSALGNELASDRGPFPGHSLFMGCLIEGLRGGILATTQDPLITGTEIGRYVQRRVIDYPSSKQTPDFGALELDDRGELVVRLPAPKPAPAAQKQRSASTTLLGPPAVAVDRRTAIGSGVIPRPSHAGPSPRSDNARPPLPGVPEPDPAPTNDTVPMTCAVPSEDDTDTT